MNQTKKLLAVGVAVLAALGVFSVSTAQVNTSSTAQPQVTKTILTQQNTTTKTIDTQPTTTPSTPTPTTTPTPTPTPTPVAASTEVTVNVGPAIGGAPSTLIIATTPGAIAPQDVPKTFEDPRTTGTERTDTIVVSGVAATVAVPAATTTPAVTTLTIQGKTTTPNAFVTIYIFSTPIVVVVQADADGNWQYTLTKELPDGSHQVYAAVTNAQGTIVAKSQPVSFTKQAAALTVEGTLTGTTPAAEPSLVNGFTLTILAILIGVLIAGLFLYFGNRNPRVDMAGTSGNQTPPATGGPTSPQA